MSETTTPPAPATPPPSPAPLISSSPANQSTAAVSGLSSSGLMVVLIWALGLAHVTVPPEVAVVLVSMIGAGVHWLILTYGTPAVEAAPKP
jgi:hypothetical protein